MLVLRKESSSTHSDRFEEYLDFIAPWVPEIEIKALRTRNVPGEGQEIDLFYREPPRRAEKEIAWAGDGIQVWLQLLLHVFRLRTADVIVLDEPDLYLHADLQRRLVRFLEETNTQTITASHSSEMIAEADRSSIVWVDKSRGAAVRAPKDDSIIAISNSIGSQFNLRLAKALRVKTVLFVEGDDMKVLTHLCRIAGAARLAAEAGIAVIPINGFDNWSHIEPFQWIVDKFLLKAVTTFVILDRDYRPEVSVQGVESRLRDIGAIPHVWARKELESYLLNAAVIARVSGSSLDEVQGLLDRVCSSFKQMVFARALEAKCVVEVTARRHRVTITEQFQQEFEQHWGDPTFRLSVVPPKDVLHEINRELQSSGSSPVSARRLAASVQREELADEVVALITGIEDTL